MSDLYGDGQLAQFPAQVWDGTNEVSRNTALITNRVRRAPDGFDFWQLMLEIQALQSQLLALPAWADLTVANTWTLGTVHAGVRVDATGHVSLRGSLTAGTITDGTTIATLPVGSYPAVAMTFLVGPTSGGTGGDASARILIGIDGTIKCYGLTNDTDLSLAGVSFYTEQNVLSPLGPWTDLTPANSWSQGAVHLGFRVLYNGLVTLRGSITHGTRTDATTLATLPAGARPAHAVTLAIAPTSGGTGGDASARVLIGSDGTIKCYGLSADTDLSFAGLFFYTDQ